MIAPLFSLFALAASPLAPSLEPREAERVVVVPVKGPIDIIPVALVQRGIRAAKDKKAKALILEIDTPGGSVEEMWKIARPLNELSERRDGILTVAFINTHAISAGAAIATACERIYMVPSGSIGAMMPVRQDPLGQIVPIAEDPEVRAKLYAAFRADFRALAESRNRNPEIAEGMVDPNLFLQYVEIDGERKVLKSEEIDERMAKGEKVTILETVKPRGEPLSLSAEKALLYQPQFIDGKVADRAELLETLSLQGAEVEEITQTWSEDLVRFLNAIAPALLILGFVLAFVEMKIPGFGVFGILSVACFLLLFFGNYLAGLAEIYHIILFFLGIGLILVEIFLFPGFIVFAAVGFLCVLFALVSSFLGFYWPERALDYEALKQTAAMFSWTLLVISVVVLLLGWLISKYLARIPFFGKRLVMPAQEESYRRGAAPISEEAEARYLGKTGTALTDLRPAGKIEIEGATLDAQSDGGWISQGSAVRVIEVSTNRIVVARVG